MRGLLVDGLGTAERLGNLGVGTLALFVGVAMISSALVRPIAAVVGWPIARLRGASGELARENADGAIVDRGFADEHDLAMGDPVEITSPSGDTLTRTVTGIMAQPRLSPLLGAVVVSQRSFDSTFEHAKDLYAFVATGDAPSAATTASLEASLAEFPDTAVNTVPEFVTTQVEDLTVILNLLYVLLALSVVVSLFGTVNTLALAVHERTRELGMLRAVGMTRRQARGMVRGESIITALVGAALGVPLGIGLAALTTRSLAERGVQLSIPVGMLAAFTAVAVVVGVIATVLPARRASRLDVLRALRYE